MKRSEINKALKELEAMCAREHCYLPPFCHFTPEEWQSKGHEYDEVRDCMLGWDITDYGLGNFDKVGMSLITIRNGNRAMQEKYPDVVGWIYGANTGLDWPIVQTAEEGGEYYLYRDIDGKDNKNGTVFLDWRCSSDFSTQNNMIYGHNMKTGLMFAPLIKYKSQAFYDAHSYLYLYTPSQTYKVNLFAGMETPHDSEVYSYSLSSSYLQECINSSTFRSGLGVPTGNILTLSTCDYDYANARYVLMGELEPIDDPW